MRTRRRSLNLLVAFAAIAPWPLTSGSHPQAADEAGASEPAWTMQGDLDFGFRWASPGGNEDKYREDWNFQTGPRLFNMAVSVRPLTPSFADVFRLDAINLGGDPFARLGLALRKFDRYAFRFERRTSKYFYRDIIVPHEEASIEASSGGDFHTFDFERVSDAYELDVELGTDAGFFVRFNRQTRIGDSTTTLDVSRDEFEMDRPLVEEKNDYRAGFRFSKGQLAFVVDQSVRDYTNDGRLFLPGASVGENPEGTTELDSFEQLLPLDFTMPQTTLRISHNPHPRVSVNGSVVFSTLDGELDYQELARGVAFDGTALSENLRGQASLSRHSRLLEADVHYRLSPKLAILGAMRFRRFDQEGRLVVDSEVETSGLELSSGSAELAARWNPLGNRPRLSLTAGARYQSRDVAGAGALGGREDINTRRTTVFARAVARPHERLRLVGDIEKGDDDNPYTLVSPTARDRISARLKFRGPSGLSLTTAAVHRRLRNSLSDMRSDSSGVSGRVNLRRETLSLYAGYARHGLDFDLMNTIRTLPGFLGDQSFDYASFYESRTHSVDGGGRLAVSPILDIGGDVRGHRNQGSFELNWWSLRLFAELDLADGYALRCSYQRSDYGEADFDFDDYHLDMVVISFGYRF